MSRTTKRIRESPLQVHGSHNPTLSGTSSWTSTSLRLALPNPPKGRLSRISSVSLSTVSLLLWRCIDLLTPYRIAIRQLVFLGAKVLGILDHPHVSTPTPLRAFATDFHAKLYAIMDQQSFVAGPIPTQGGYADRPSSAGHCQVEPNRRLYPSIAAGRQAWSTRL
jgi:hypothetical protein